MTPESRQRLKYVVCDFMASNIGWLTFNVIRYCISKETLELQGAHTLFDFLKFPSVVLGQVLLPFVMMAVYWLSGYYNVVFRKSRLEELFASLWSTFVNTILIFAVVLINDMVEERMRNYELILTLWSCMFLFIYLPRLIITVKATNRIRRRELVFNTLIVGDGEDGHDLARKLQKPPFTGYNIVGFVKIPDETPCDSSLRVDMPVYDMHGIEDVCKRLNIRELLIAPTGGGITKTLSVINSLFITNLPMRLTPNLYGILISKVNIDALSSEPFIDISGSSLSECSKNIKRVGDILLSVLAMALLSPLFLIVSIIIKSTSKGPVFYRQERVGYRNKKFEIIKFRTMYENAESDGVPQLSKENDCRITPFGRFMRKYRIDELPQFINVIKGDMSIVGPRPERQYYIDKILKVAPYYALVHQVRPGITSLGMVKFGYAVNVDEMVQRLNYDLIYIENMSLFNDVKILIYTIKTVLTGRGL